MPEHHFLIHEDSPLPSPPATRLSRAGKSFVCPMIRQNARRGTAHRRVGRQTADAGTRDGATVPTSSSTPSGQNKSARPDKPHDDSLASPHAKSAKPTRARCARERDPRGAPSRRSHVPIRAGQSRCCCLLAKYPAQSRARQHAHTPNAPAHSTSQPRLEAHRPMPLRTRRSSPRATTRAPRHPTEGQGAPYQSG